LSARESLQQEVVQSALAPSEAESSSEQFAQLGMSEYMPLASSDNVAQISDEALSSSTNDATGGSNLNLASIHQHVSSGGNKDITSMRPGASSGDVDIVSFGIFAKEFFGADLKHNKYTLDGVMALSWKDPRAADLVPSGMTKLSMSGKLALKKIWMPEVVITNRDIRKLETISTTVTIFKTGLVTKVERAVVVINNKYKLEEYPFDSQKLNVKIASSKYMLDEVMLKPADDKSSSGYKKTMLEGTPYEMESWRVFAFKETDGALKKSRGVLELTVKRTFGTYQDQHFMPTCLLLAISWGVWWFPLSQPFITPRLALSILALLAFTNLMIKSSRALPNGAPSNWNDMFNFQIQAMMFCTIVLNIFTEICRHQLKVEEISVNCNFQSKILMPSLSMIVITIVLTAGSFKWLSLGMAGIVTKLITGIVIVTFFVSHLNGVAAAQAEAAQKKAAEEKIKAVSAV